MQVFHGNDFRCQATKQFAIPTSLIQNTALVIWASPGHRPHKPGIP